MDAIDRNVAGELSEWAAVALALAFWWCALALLA